MMKEGRNVSWGWEKKEINQDKDLKDNEKRTEKKGR